MSKPAVPGQELRRQGRLPREVAATVEGQIEEICRDLAVEVKRIRQLQAQAEELRNDLRQWVGGVDDSHGATR